MSARVRDVMTTRVVAVTRGATFKDITALLTEYRVSAFPVVDGQGAVVGVVSEADLLTKEALVPAMGWQAVRLGRTRAAPYRGDLAKAAAAVTAADLMTTPPIVVTPDEPVTSAARLMYHARVKRLPVVDEEGQLAGIISRADVLSVYSRPDEAIRQEITKNVIVNEFSAHPGRFAVTVYGGVVTIEGYPETTACGRDLVAETWDVEGVVSVRDRLTYPEGKLPMFPNSALSARDTGGHKQATAGSSPESGAAGKGSRSQGRPQSAASPSPAACFWASCSARRLIVSSIFRSITHDPGSMIG